MKIVIINPISPELVRASFCYTPFFLHAGLSARGEDVTLLERFTVPDLDTVPAADLYLVALWSRTQIETVRMLVRFLPGPVKVFGYNPLIKEQRLPHHVVTDDELLDGMFEYPFRLDQYEDIFVDEPDMHLAAYSDKPATPIFTAYGCPWGCNFCPAGINQSKQVKLSLVAVSGILHDMKRQLRTNLHLTDEDFFLDRDRAHSILELLAEIGGFNVVALTSRHTLKGYLTKYGPAAFEPAGIRLFEIGMESAADEIGRKMGKGRFAPCEEIAASCPVPILWLNLTFYPGETIGTLRRTGDFMRDHGLRWDQLTPRMRTNGTHGGLGQFFMTYDGAQYGMNVREEGTILTDRPLRLWPSFIPHSFANSVIGQTRALRSDEARWFEQYRVPVFPVVGSTGHTIGEVAAWGGEPIEMFISAAIASRLGIIEEA